MAEAPRFPLGSAVSLVPSVSDLAFLLPILVLFRCTTGVGWLLADFDTGWHIRVGEWILKSGRIPAADLFSFTKFGRPWFAWEWLSDVSMAAMHSHFGLPGLVVASVFVLGATSVCVYKSTVEESGHRVTAIALTGVAMAASTIHWLARPHLVTPLFAGVFCWVLNRVETRINSERLLFVLPALLGLWVNLHGGFFVGIMLLITYAIGSAAKELVHGTRWNAWLRAQKYLLAALACTVAASSIPTDMDCMFTLSNISGRRSTSSTSASFNPSISIRLRRHISRPCWCWRSRRQPMRRRFSRRTNWDQGFACTQVGNGAVI